MSETPPGQRRPRRDSVAALVFVGAVLLAGCAGPSDDAAERMADEPLGVVPPDDGADEDGSADAGDGGGADVVGLGEAALELFEATERTCADHAEAVGNTPIDPEHFAGAKVLEVQPGDPDLVVIRDGLGVELVVVVDREEVWGGPDPDVVMPRPYSFGCPPELYVGTLDH